MPEKRATDGRTGAIPQGYILRAIIVPQNRILFPQPARRATYSSIGRSEATRLGDTGAIANSKLGEISLL
jgi:hypothetical protein